MAHGSEVNGRPAHDGTSSASRAFEQAPLPLFVVGGTPLLVTAANERYLSASGRAGDIGRPLRDVFADSGSRMVVDAIERVADSGEPAMLREHPLSLWATNGAAVDGAASTPLFDVLLQPLWDEAGAARGVIAAAIDVTARVQERLDASRRVRERANDLSRFNEALTAEMEERARGDGERDMLRRQLAAAEEAERRRLARELHDQLGQHLTALSLGLDEVAGLLPPDSPAVRRLAGLLRLTSLLTRDVRYLAVELRPPELDDVGLVSAMTTYIDQWMTRYGTPAELEVAGQRDLQLPADASTTLYRILQEALTNVAKHARASRVSVILDQSHGDVRLIIEDDGRGFDVEHVRRRARAESRLGIAGMQERVNLVHGTLDIESEPGHGTTLYVKLGAAER